MILFVFLYVVNIGIAWINRPVSQGYLKMEWKFITADLILIFLQLWSESISVATHREKKVFVIGTTAGLTLFLALVYKLEEDEAVL